MAEKLTDKDKLKHMGVCLCASILSPMLAIGLAIGKEYGDKYNAKSHWCWNDLYADGIGIVIGTILHYCMLQLLHML